MTKLRVLSVNLALLAVGAATACESTESSPSGPGGGVVGDGGAADCVEVPTDCSTVTPLKNADIQGGKVLAARTCWSVDEDLNLASGTLVVEQGVVMRFGTNKGLRVTSGGRVSLRGTCESRVRLTSKDDASTFQGVRMTDSQGADNTWTYAVIDRGGDQRWTGANYSDGALYLEGTTKLQMDHVTVSRSKSHGLIAFGEADFAFASGALTGNLTPAYLHPQVVDRLPGDVILTDNTNAYIRVAFGNTDRIAGARRWAAHALPLRIEERVRLEGDLTIDPGARLQFAQGTSLRVVAGATLTAKGAADNKITFAGAANTRGFWQGIQIESGGIGTPATIGATFDHCEISEAAGTAWTGNAESKAAVYMDSTAAAAITNTTFRNNAYYGLWADNEARLPGFASNVFTGNTRVMMLHPDRVGELGTGNTLTGNDEDAIRVVLANTNRLSADASWKAQGVPYFIDDRFIVEASLTIEAGVAMRFAQARGMVVDDKGSLTVAGTAAAPVTFAGMNEVATGYWQGVQIKSNSPKNTLSHVKVLHAGSNGWNGDPESDAAIFLSNNASVALADVTLGPGGGYGVHIEGPASPITCSAVAFTSLVKGAVWQNTPAPGALLGACP